jgi:hypothetical protein
MALYGNGVYRMGHQGYVRWGPQAALLCGPTVAADPAPQSGVSSLLGITPFPGWDKNENMQPLNGAGAYLDLNEIPTLREVSIPLNVQVQSGTFFANVVRWAPGEGTTLGLPLFALELGILDGFGDGYCVQGLDCLVNSCNFTAAERQFFTANLDIWPHVLINATAQDVSYAETEDVIRWERISVSNASTDYKPIIQNVRLSITNNLRRVGMRGYCASGIPPVEQQISRTALRQLPGLERITVSYTLYDSPPAALREPADWGQVELLGESAGGNMIRITLNHQHASRMRQQEANANDPVMFALEGMGRGITIAAV